MEFPNIIVIHMEFCYNMDYSALIHVSITLMYKLKKKKIKTMIWYPLTFFSLFLTIGELIYILALFFNSSFHFIILNESLDIQINLTYITKIHNKYNFLFVFINKALTISFPHILCALQYEWFYYIDIMFTKNNNILTLTLFLDYSAYNVLNYYIQFYIQIPI